MISLEHSAQVAQMREDGFDGGISMTWFMLAVGFFLLMSGVLGQVYSLKTKRGVLPPKTRIWRVLTRLSLFLVGLLLMAMAVGRIVLHHR
jgi:uncharacterized membrane protein HdeD (DUF308 family)